MPPRRGGCHLLGRALRGYANYRKLVPLLEALRSPIVYTSFVASPMMRVICKNTSHHTYYYYQRQLLLPKISTRPKQESERRSEAASSPVTRAISSQAIDYSNAHPSPYLAEVVRRLLLRPFSVSQQFRLRSSLQIGRAHV